MPQFCHKFVAFVAKLGHLPQNYGILPQKMPQICGIFVANATILPFATNLWHFFVANATNLWQMSQFCHKIMAFVQLEVLWNFQQKQRLNFLSTKLFC